MAISKIQVGNTEHEIQTTIGNVSGLQSALDGKLSKSGGMMNDGATIKLSTYGTRYVTLSGNSITADMSNETGGWAGNFASVKDPSGATTSMLGWYGNASGLTHIYMGGTYSDPFMKMTPAGQFTFKNAPKVGSTDVALKTDIPSVPTKTSDLENDSGFKTTDTNTTYTFATNKNATNGSAQLRLTAGGSGSGNQIVQVIGANGIKVQTNASGNAITITGASTSATKVYCHQYKITLNSYESPPYAQMTYTLYSTSSTTLANSSNFLELLKNTATHSPYLVYVYDSADGGRVGTGTSITDTHFHCGYMSTISAPSTFTTSSYTITNTTITQV